MVMIWFCFMAALALIRARLENCKWQRGFRKLGIPGTLSVPAFTLFPVAVNSVGSMIQRRSAASEDDPASSRLETAMIVLGLLIGAVVPILATVWIANEVRKHEIFEHVYEEMKEAEKNEKKKKKGKNSNGKKIQMKRRMR